MPLESIARNRNIVKSVVAEQGGLRRRMPVIYWSGRVWQNENGHQLGLVCPRDTLLLALSAPFHLQILILLLTISMVLHI